MNSTVDDTFLDAMLEKWKDANGGSDFIVQLDELYQMYPNRNELVKYNFAIKMAQYEVTVNNLDRESPRYKELLTEFLGHEYKRFRLPNYSSLEITVREHLTELLRVYKPAELKELPDNGYNYIMGHAMHGSRFYHHIRTNEIEILDHGLDGIYSSETIVLSDAKPMIRTILKNMLKEFYMIYDDLCVPTYLEEERAFKLQREADLQYFKTETSPVEPGLGTISPALFSI
jgi:hypothetical protein